MVTCQGEEKHSKAKNTKEYNVVENMWENSNGDNFFRGGNKTKEAWKFVSELWENVQERSNVSLTTIGKWKIIWKIAEWRKEPVHSMGRCDYYNLQVREC